MIEHPSSVPLLFHDYFGIRGGGERLVLDLARALDADLVYGYRTLQSYSAEEFPASTRSLDAERVKLIPGLAPLALSLRFAAERRFASRRAIRIFSGVAAPFAAPARGAGINIFYCHTPPRFLYDQKQFYRDKGGLVRRLGLSLAGPWFQHSYEAAVNRMDVVVANSENVRQRIKTYLGRDSIVVYPPVDTAGFQWGMPQGYYLSTARLSPLKRIRTVIEAFLAMPDRQLVVASGGDQDRQLRDLADGARNITFTGWIDDVRMKALVAGAIATIYIPVDEDFGMSPVESMAAGKPVIGVAEGGLLETMLPGETGILLPANPSADHLEAAVRQLTPQRALAMRAACEARAQLFTRERFLSGMQAVITNARAKGNMP